ncbi:MAG: LysR substrate-binding domain-containing protein [Pseudomonas sp.]|nr:LysR substrate-binding domain-containing protein [Pseudomonas sp.]
MSEPVYTIPMRDDPTMPPLQALRAFDAVARLMSFRLAGEELLISQSAVSHHIARLEQHLGFRLFVRSGRSIALTPVGADLAAEVKKGFGIIGRAAQRANRQRRRVCVSVLPSFASHWLAPRLAKLRDDLADFDVVISPTLSLADLHSGEIDVAIRFGRGKWKDADARLLAEEHFTPVLAPSLNERFPVNSAKDLWQHTLLRSSPAIDWTAWEAATDLDLATVPSMELSDYNVALQAAVDGQGVAIGRKHMIAQKIQLGQLVAPLDLSVREPGLGYWLAHAEGKLSPETSAFCEWMVAQMEEK